MTAPAKRVVETLQGPAGQISLQGDSSEEVIAFAVAAIRAADPDVRAYLEAHTIIVDTVEAGRQLIEASQLGYILQDGPAGSPSQYAQRGPTLIPVGRSQRNGTAEKLDRPSAHAFAQGLVAMGLDEQTAMALAKGSGKSLAALRRLRPSGQYAPPKWLASGHDLLAAILCGGWENGNAKDRAALEALDGRRCYDEILQSYRTYLTREDAPLEQAAGSWVVRAPMDAFMEAGHLIGEDDIRRFETVARRVFSEVEPEPDPDDPISLPRRGADDRHSDLLRDGLATTLLLLTVWQEPAEVPIAKGEGQRIANALVRELPGLIDERVISSLQNQLPLLAEAAPVPLLEGLERSLEGETETLRTLMADKPGLMGPFASHPPLLWALETLAWDPAYFPRAVQGLAWLAEIDDQSNRYGNRPLNSLREIFLPWNPNTNVGAEQRLCAVDAIIDSVPHTAWRLVTALLPSPHGVSSPTAKPTLREAGASNREQITYQSLWAMHTALVTRAIRLARAEPDRWITLVEGVANLAPDDRGLILEALPGPMEAWDEANRQKMWSALHDLVSTHRDFADAKWALSKDQIEPWEALVEQYRPSDPLVELTRLFDAWPRGEDMASVDKTRANALEQAVGRQGLSIAMDLALIVRSPYLVAQALLEIGVVAGDLEALMLEAIGRSGLGLDFALSLSSVIRRRQSEEDAATWFTGLAGRQAWDADTTASLLLGWPNSRATWRLAERLGDGVQEAFWRKRSGFRIEGSAEELLEAVSRFVNVGRATIALQVALDRLDDLPSKLMLSMIVAVVDELNGGRAAPDTTMLSYYLEKAFKNLDGRSDIDDEQIAAAEFSVLPLLERSSRTLKLNSILAKSPDAYHALLRVVFRGESEPVPESNEDQQAQWRACYSVISQFHQVPGMRPDEAMDADILCAWVERARALGAQTDRQAITDVYIGHLLAHAPADRRDGAWPDVAVRRLVQDLQNKDIGRGIKTERFNMRGVHMRGVFDGGEQERDLAKRYRGWSEASSAFPRMAALLNKMAEEWEALAAHEDGRADALKLRR